MINEPEHCLEELKFTFIQLNQSIVYQSRRVVHFYSILSRRLHVDYLFPAEQDRGSLADPISVMFVFCRDMLSTTCTY